MASTKKQAITEQKTKTPVKKTPAASSTGRSSSGRKTVPAKATGKTTVAATVRPAKEAGIRVEVINMAGKSAGTMTLPEAIFSAKVNKALMAQAVRVYRANQRVAQASTKTRGEVAGSTRKIYRQKGTGRARHGGITAPVFVGGGVAHGPRAHEYSMTMPQKMRRAALFSALTAKQQGKSIKVVHGLDKIEPKTKAFMTFLKNAALDEKKKKVLLVLPAKAENVARSARNIEGVSYSLANQLNTYEVLNTKTIVFMQDAIEILEKTFIKGGNA